MPTPLRLSVTDLTVERGGRAVVSGLSFSVQSGEALLVTGPNGAGKTTLLRAIAGFIAPMAGSVTLDGADGDRPLVEHCHIVGHLNGIKPGLTVAENLDFAADYLKAGGASSMPADRPASCVADRALRRTRVDAALDRLALSRLADIPAGYLSAGQKRRVCLARLLVADRPVWLLDEPTVSLDRASTGLVAGLIDQHVAGGGIAVIVTHVPLGLSAARELELGRTVLEATR